MLVSDARVLELCLKYGDEEMAASLRQRAYYGARPDPHLSAADFALGDGEVSPANMTRASETILLLDPDSPRTTPRNSFSGDAGLLLLAQHAQRYGPAAADAAASAHPAALDAVGRALSGTGAELTSPPEGVSPLQRSGSQSSRRSESSVSQLRAPPDAGSPRSPRSPRSPSIAEAAPPPAAPAPEVPCPSFTTDELEALKAGCAFAEFGPTHELALAYMRWRRDEALAAGGGEEPLSAEFAADIRLVRFLAACGWDAMAAADMYVEALQWRTEQRMDEVREQLVRANAAFFERGGEVLTDVIATAHDAAVQAVQPRTFTRALPGGGGHAPLLDRQGNLVCIECPGLVDNAGIAALGTAAWARSYLCGIELGILIIDELSRRQGRLVLMFRCFDMVGFKMVKVFQSREEKEGERAFKEASGIASKVYPTTTFKNFFFNLPAAGAAGPIVKAMAPARSAKKFVLLGTKFQDELFAHVEQSQLPRRLGGVLDDGVQWGGEKKKKK